VSPTRPASPRAWRSRGASARDRRGRRRSRWSSATSRPSALVGGTRVHGRGSRIGVVGTRDRVASRPPRASCSRSAESAPRRAAAVRPAAERAGGTSHSTLRTRLRGRPGTAISDRSGATRSGSDTTPASLRRSQLEIRGQRFGRGGVARRSRAWRPVPDPRACGRGAAPDHRMKPCRESPMLNDGDRPHARCAHPLDQ